MRRNNRFLALIPVLGLATFGSAMSCGDLGRFGGGGKSGGKLCYVKTAAELAAGIDDKCTMIFVEDQERDKPFVLEKASDELLLIDFGADNAVAPDYPVRPGSQTTDLTLVGLRASTVRANGLNLRHARIGASNVIIDSPVIESVRYEPPAGPAVAVGVPRSLGVDLGPSTHTIEIICGAGEGTCDPVGLGLGVDPETPLEDVTFKVESVVVDVLNITGRLTTFEPLKALGAKLRHVVMTSTPQDAAIVDGYKAWLTENGFTGEVHACLAEPCPESPVIEERVRQAPSSTGEQG